MNSQSLTAAAVRGATSRPLATTWDQVVGLAVLPIWSQTRPSLAGLLDTSRSSAYDAVASGSVPSVRIGGRTFVPTARLATMLGIDPATLNLGAPNGAQLAPVGEAVASAPAGGGA